MLTSFANNQLVALAESSKTEIVEDFAEALAGALLNITEATKEAQEDAAVTNKVVTAGNWWVVRNVDKLAWSTFHLAVQADIILKYLESNPKAIATQEKKIDFFDDKELKTGKWGRADIAIEIEGDMYLWEVKPYSYSVEPKKSLGES